MKIFRFRVCKSYAFIAAVCLAANSLAAPVTSSPSSDHGLPFIHPIFDSHMVLPRDAEDPVWGWAEPGESVTVVVQATDSRLSLQTKTTHAGHDGRWEVSLGPFPFRNTSLNLVISSDHKPPVTLTDILVGDVWLCSGQSNMARSLAYHEGIPDVPDQDAEIAATIKYPLIRQYYVANLAAAQPQLVPTALETDETGHSGPWLVNNPMNAARPSRYTAVGYFFARQLHQALHVPIGIVQMSWGGTPIEGWIDPATLSQNPDFRNMGTVPPNPNPSTGGAIYNGKVATIVPFRFKGVIWYQGESNEGKPEQYRSLLPLLMKSWRQNFKQPGLPFIVIQLPNYKNDSWAILRDAQFNAVRADSRSRLVVTIDLGDANQLHPGDEQDVGSRAALAALDLAYGQRLVASGPLFARASVMGSTLRCEFTDVGAGLMVGRREVPPARPGIRTAEVAGGLLSGFEIAGIDGVFHPATAVIISPTTVAATCSAVPSPTSIRYAWAGAPVCNLYNKICDSGGEVRDGLPASPFRFPE